MEHTLNILQNKALSVDRLSVQKVLILLDLNRFFLGDTCLQISRLKKAKSFYFNADIHVNTADPKYFKLITPFILHNPYISRYTNLSWDNIRFETYDLVICACIPEQKFLDFYSKKYNSKLISRSINTAVFSALGSIGLNEELAYGKALLPINSEINEYQLATEDQSSMLANELFISSEEVEWADIWLKEKGVKDTEKVIICLDNASSKEKMLNTNTYFEILNWFLEKESTKVVIFDENNLGKKMFYDMWLGPEKSSKLIFVEGKSLREAMNLISSRYIKFIFGPSTGLLHCASGIYNVLSRKNFFYGREIPKMIAYTGLVNNGFVEHLWWKDSLVEGIVLITSLTEKKILTISEWEADKSLSIQNVLNCSAITSPLLINYLSNIPNI